MFSCYNLKLKLRITIILNILVAIWNKICWKICKSLPFILSFYLYFGIISHASCIHLWLFQQSKFNLNYFSCCLVFYPSVMNSVKPLNRKFRHHFKIFTAQANFFINSNLLLGKHWKLMKIINFVTDRYYFQKGQYPKEGCSLHLSQCLLDFNIHCNTKYYRWKLKMHKIYNNTMCREWQEGLYSWVSFTFTVSLLSYKESIFSLYHFQHFRLSPETITV